MRTVKAVVQIVGLSRSPAVPKYADDVRSWYTKVRAQTVDIKVYLTIIVALLGRLAVLPCHCRRSVQESFLQARFNNHLRSVLCIYPAKKALTAFLDETQPAKLMICAFPTIKDFVREALQRSPLNNATSRLNNSA